MNLFLFPTRVEITDIQDYNALFLLVIVTNHRTTIETAGIGAVLL
jgi:hypothetical protein